MSSGPKIFYFCHATQVITNISCRSSLLQLEKQHFITPSPLHFSITHGNFNCHNKVFFQVLKFIIILAEVALDVAVGMGLSHKSRRGIVIGTRWTLNHR